MGDSFFQRYHSPSGRGKLSPYPPCPLSDIIITMIDQNLKDQIEKIVLPLVQSPGQYIGGEWNAVAKDHSGGSRHALPGVSRRLFHRHEP